MLVFEYFCIHNLNGCDNLYGTMKICLDFRCDQQKKEKYHKFNTYLQIYELI